MDGMKFIRVHSVNADGLIVDIAQKTMQRKLGDAGTIGRFELAFQYQIKKKRKIEWPKTAISTISPVGKDGMKFIRVHSVNADGANCGYCPVSYLQDVWRSWMMMMMMMTTFLFPLRSG